MRADRRQSAMTLVEILVALTVILILIGALSGAGIHLKRQSEIRLTEGTLGVLVMALEQYYTDYSAYVPQVNSEAEFETESGFPSVTISQGVHLQDTVVNPFLEEAAWSSEALYYFLNRSPNAAAITSALMDQVVSNRDASGGVLLIEIPTGGAPCDLIRFVDAWGMPIQYAYDPAVDPFPILTSAGPDKRFDTAGDNIINQ